MISTMMRTSRTEPTIVACVVAAAAWAEGGRTSKPFGAAELDAQAVLVAAAAVGDGEPVADAVAAGLLVAVAVWAQVEVAAG